MLQRLHRKVCVKNDFEFKNTDFKNTCNASGYRGLNGVKTWDRESRRDNAVKIPMDKLKITDPVGKLADKK